MDFSVKNTAQAAAYTAMQSSTQQTISPPKQQESSTRTDRLELSGREPQQDVFQAMKERMEQTRAEIAQQAQQARDQAKAEADALKVKLLCFKIAMRILAGDKVPPEDEKYLLDNDPDLYNVAVSGRIQKEDPEEYDSLLEDDEEDGAADPLEGVTRAASGEEAPAAEAPAEAAPAELLE